MTVHSTNIRNQFDEISLSKNKVLFRQGEISNSLYVLVEGKLAVFIKKENKETKFIAEIEPGETVGELSAISHEPRLFTVKSIRKFHFAQVVKRSVYCNMFSISCCRHCNDQ